MTLLVVLTPLATFAVNPFTDLQAGSVHNANIDAIYNAGITTGCDPNVRYCPTDLVTRQEMASFLARTAGLGTNPPVANAKTAQTAALATNATNAVNATNATNAIHATSADTATSATNAGNANTVGGLAPNGLVRVARASVLSLGSALPTASLITAQITAPAAGFVLVNGTTNPFAFSSGNTCPCQAVARLHHIQGDTQSLDAIVYLPNTPSGSSGGSIALTWIFPVTAGAQTFEILVTATITHYNPTLTLLYVPFGSMGAGALEEAGSNNQAPAPHTVP